MHPDFALSAALRLLRYGEGKARPKGSARRPRRRLSKGVDRGVFATSDSGGHWRRYVARQPWDRRTAFWPLGEAQNWRQAPPTREGLAPVTLRRHRDPDALDRHNQLLFSADPGFGLLLPAAAQTLRLRL